MPTVRLALAAVLLCLTASAQEKAKSPAPIVLLDGKSMADWEKVDVGGSGDVALEEGEFIISGGEGVSGAVYKKAKDLPLQNYEIALETKRVQGSDFFCGLTFPVGDLKTCVTLVLGGWGGAVTGISSIDGLDASENNTSSYQRFADNTWYKLVVRVTPKDIKVTLDGKEIIDTDIEGKKLGVRPGPIESFLPLSLTTYSTTGAFRNMKVTPIKEAK